MQITLDLNPVEASLLRCLAPRGNARKDNYLETTAQNLLVTAIKREARSRRVSSEQALGVALVETVERRKQAR